MLHFQFSFSTWGMKKIIKMRNKETKEKGKQNSCILYVTPYLSRSSFISFENWVVSNNIGRRTDLPLSV